MSNSDVVAWIGTLGFPIVAYFYNIIRLEKIISKNTEAVDRLVVTVEKLINIIDKLVDKVS